MYPKIVEVLVILLSNILWFCVIKIINIIDFIYRCTIYNNERIHFYYVFFIEYLTIALASFGGFFIFLLRPGYEGNSCLLAPLARHLAKMFGVNVTVRNKEHLTIDSGAICTINHQSMFDLIITLNFWDIPKKMIVLGKKELQYLPPYGPLGLLAGLKFVPRNNSLEAREQLNVIANILRERKVKMLVYPEGTRNSNWAEFLPFKKGGFHTAVNAQIPIIPMVISPYYFLNSKKKIFGKGRVIIQCLEPVPTKGLTQADVPALVEKVRNLMFKKYQELTKEVLEAEADQKFDLK